MCCSGAPQQHSWLLLVVAGATRGIPASRELLQTDWGQQRLLFLFRVLECDPPPVGVVFTHLAEEEQGQACDWNHMCWRQVMRVISHTAAAERVIQTARGYLAAISGVDRWCDSHLSCCVREHEGPGRIHLQKVTELSEEIADAAWCVWPVALQAL